MKFVNKSELSTVEKNLLKDAFIAAKKSVTGAGHMVGTAIMCENGEIYTGATNARSRVIGSTCAERMAVDQLYFGNNKKPKLIVSVGILKLDDWSEDFVCTPCGVCLEMIRELIMSLNIDDIDFLFSSWNQKRFLRSSLKELLPQIR